MPLIHDKERFSDKDRWFPPECGTDKPATEELLWNLRHAALFENDWFDGQPVHDWTGEGTVIITAGCNIDAYYGEYPEHGCRALSIINKSELLRVEFEALDKKWRRETRHLSLVSKKIAHPAYLRIIAMGEPAIPLLLESLRDRPSHWFAALQAIANTDPCHIDATPAQARDAWLNWGTSHGYIDWEHV
jgi:hypothetical protein